MNDTKERLLVTGEKVASTVEERRQPCAEAFGLWIGTIARGLAATGLPEKGARVL
jgi:hypothetical protein